MPNSVPVDDTRELTDSAPEVATARPAFRGLARLVGGFRELARGLLFEARFRWLRWVLLIGFVVRLALAPITSWAIDTPSFVLSDLSLVYTGNPYTSQLLFNPPLGTYVEAPFVGMVALALGPQAMVPLIDAIFPAVNASGILLSLVPIPAALVALKLPLILADGAVALVLWVLVRISTNERTANVAAALWFLNPLVIWASAVHGEVDGLAILFVLLFLWALLQRWPLLSGVFLSLAIFAKAYPIVLVPIGVVFWLLPYLANPAPLRQRLAPLGRFAAGIALGALPFALILPDLFASLVQRSSGALYGGISVLVLYNTGAPVLPGGWGGWEAPTLAPYALALVRALAVLAVIAATYAVVRRRLQVRNPDPRVALPWLATISLLAVIGFWIADSVPESENVLAPLALLLVAAPILGKSGWPRRFATHVAVPAFLILSGAAFALYMTLLTPLAYFYPLALLLGGSAVTRINDAVISYVQTTGIGSQTFFWTIEGLVGGGTLLFLWALSLHRLLLDRRAGRTGEVVRVA